MGVHLGLEVVLKLQKEYPTTVETLRSLPGLVYLWIIMREERMEALRQDRWAISKEEGQDYNYGDQILSQDKPAPAIFC